MTTPPGQSDGNVYGWGLAGLIVFLFIAVSFCSKSESPTGLPDSAENFEQAANNLEAAAEAIEPVPLDASAVQRGASQLKVVASLDLPGSRKIFSQNCYDALATKFDWHQLDRCGGFDALAARWVEYGASLSDDEPAYFQSEAAATRYLSAATSNGLAGGDADIRWANLESAARKLSLPMQAAVANNAVGPNVGTSEESGDPNVPEHETEDDPLAPAVTAPQ